MQTRGIYVANFVTLWYTVATLRENSLHYSYDVCRGQARVRVLREQASERMHHHPGQVRRRQCNARLNVYLACQRVLTFNFAQAFRFSS